MQAAVAGLKVTMIDNYDSFTYNLVQYMQEIELEVETLRNDKVSSAQVVAAKPDFIVISPGPSTPEQAGICLELVLEAMAAKIPLFGVCLGHQCIGQALGAKIVKIDPPMHGKVSEIFHTGIGVFSNLPSPLAATRYHSLVIAPEGLPTCLEVTAYTKDNIIMGVKHKEHCIEGVQFHPESVLTPLGKAMLLQFAQAVTAGRT